MVVPRSYGAAGANVRRSGAYRGAVLSFEFLVLTATRSAEIRGATWDEVDLAAVWTTSVRCMKTAGECRRRPAAPRQQPFPVAVHHHRGLPAPGCRIDSQWES